MIPVHITAAAPMAQARSMSCDCKYTGSMMVSV